MIIQNGGIISMLSIFKTLSLSLVAEAITGLKYHRPTGQNSSFSSHTLSLMSELSQYHPELRVSRVMDFPNKGFFIIGNTPRDVVTLQSENKMKACLDQNLKISLPKAYQMKEKSKTLVVKGVPIEFTNNEFKETLDYNKI